MSARNAQREKLEGSLLTVCVDCKEMVVQVNYQLKNENQTCFHPSRIKYWIGTIWFNLVLKNRPVMIFFTQKEYPNYSKK